MEGTNLSFAELMTLEPIALDLVRGTAPVYPWGRVYGGLVVAQALRAAAGTVDPAHRVHSLHAYFIRGGTSDEPIAYEIDRIRDGRSFLTRRVVARQSSGAILNLDASFQTEEAGQANVQIEHLPENLPDPEALPDEGWSRLLDNRAVPLADRRGRARAWLKMRESLGDDPVLQACGLAYASDDVPIDACVRLHPRCPPPEERNAEYDVFMSASLDHAIWFHRPFRADEWMLHDVSSYGLGGARGLSIARLFARDGRHVATVTQECLLRERRIA